MAVLGAVCRCGDAAASKLLLHVYVRAPHMRFHPCQRGRRSVILMEAECYFILPLVTAVSRERETVESLARPRAHPLHLRDDRRRFGFIRRVLIHDVVFKKKKKKYSEPRLFL